MDNDRGVPVIHYRRSATGPVWVVMLDGTTLGHVGRMAKNPCHWWAVDGRPNGLILGHHYPSRAAAADALVQYRNPVYL